MGSLAYNLTGAAREALLSRFPAKFAVVKCDHITVTFPACENDPLPKLPARVLVVGYGCDDSGVECLVVEVDGTIARADGETFHITLSRGADRQSVESNHVIKNHGWKRFDEPVTIAVIPAYNE